MLGLPRGYEPTKFLYKMLKDQTKDLLDTNETYPYDWYLGGVDSCTGDSGGPLWRNINKETKIEWSALIGSDYQRYCALIGWLVGSECSGIRELA